MADQPTRYAFLDFNAPMGDALATDLVRVLTRRAPGSVVDIGCGWGELLLRVLAASPGAHGVGIDHDEELLARGRANAASRGLTDRVTFRENLPAGLQADVVVCVGADHVFGTQADALAALHEHVVPGGRVLLGTGFWEVPPTADQAAVIGAEPGDLTALADLVSLARSHGFRLLDLRTATRREWESFESGYLADVEEWLLTADLTDPDVRAHADDADEHLAGWLRGYRDVLGFAYLTLGRSA